MLTKELKQYLALKHAKTQVATKMPLKTSPGPWSRGIVVLL
jgi:hypothetical protein